MRMFSRLIGKVGAMTVGVGFGMVLAAGGGVAAIHYSQLASDHSIAAQPAAVADDRGGSRLTGSDDVLGAGVTPGAVRSSEPEPGDDRRSGTALAAQPSAAATRGNGTPDDGAHRESSATPEPGDDNGKDRVR